MYINNFRKWAFGKVFKKSIKYRMILIIMLSCITSVTITSILFITSGVSHTKEILKKESQTLAKAVGDRNAAALAFYEISPFKIDLSLLMANESVESACLYNNTGKIFGTYSPDKTSNTNCPHPKNTASNFIDKHLIIFQDIERNGQAIGRVFIQSNLSRVDDFISNSIKTTMKVIICIILISYLMAAKLQKSIHTPILTVMEETKLAAIDGSYSTRVSKFSEDELGVIVDTFNNILEEREKRYNEFYKKSLEIKNISEQYDTALSHLDREFKTPFNAINSYRSLMEKQVFGPINKLYIEYFNDICTADIELYTTVNKVMELYKMQSGLYSEEAVYFTIEEIITKILEKYKLSKNSSDIRINLDKSPLSKLAVKKHAEQLIDKVTEIILLNIDTQSNQTISVMTQSKNNEAYSYLQVCVQLKNIDNKSKYVNDNFHETPLRTLLNKIRNFEHDSNKEDNYQIDFSDMVIRGKLNVINFISKIYKTDISVSISQSSIQFNILFPFEETVVQNDSVKELA